MQTGFRDWNKNDFNNFITGCEKHGRKNLELIANIVGKPLEAVLKYSKVFW